MYNIIYSRVLLVSCSWGHPLEDSHHLRFRFSRKLFSCKCRMASEKFVTSGSSAWNARPSPLAVLKPGTRKRKRRKLVYVIIIKFAVGDGLEVRPRILGCDVRLPGICWIPRLKRETHKSFLKYTKYRRCRFLFFCHCTLYVLVNECF